MGLFDDLQRIVTGAGSGAVVAEGDALPGREERIPVADAHLVLGRPMQGPLPDHVETIVLGMGCFWGAEKHLWQLPGVWTTAAGYAGGWTRNPTYTETCTGRTGHTEVVLVAFDPSELPVTRLLAEFFEMHDPTQGMRQGNDMGSQYRSAIFATTAEQLAAAESVRQTYQRALDEHGRGQITTEIGMLSDVRSGEFFFAEDYHQQYLAKNPGGYDCHVRSGVACPV